MRAARPAETVCVSAAAEGALHYTTSKNHRSRAPKAVGCIRVFGGSCSLMLFRGQISLHQSALTASSSLFLEEQQFGRGNASLLELLLVAALPYETMCIEQEDTDPQQPVVCRPGMQEDIHQEG